jgi:hypothetical protein
MLPIDQHIAELKKHYSTAIVNLQPNGSYLVEIPNYPMPPGWNQRSVTILFLAPTGYPGAQPDCFWVEPRGIRLENGATPQNSNDTNEIPGVGQRGTWFSWHLQKWDPNRDSLLTYLNVIKQRLSPPR